MKKVTLLTIGLIFICSMGYSATYEKVYDKVLKETKIVETFITVKELNKQKEKLLKQIAVIQLEIDEIDALLGEAEKVGITLTSEVISK